MTLDVGADTALVNRVISRHIKSVPTYQQEFVLSRIQEVCIGKMSYDGGLNEINRRFGQRIKATAKQILDGILLEAALPSETETGAHYGC